MICNNFFSDTCLNNCTNRNCLKSKDNRSLIKCEEKSKIYQFENERNALIYNYHIDGGVVRDSAVKKCDNLLYIEDKNKVILVELKGTDFNSAIKQIDNTLSLFKSAFLNKTVYARVVGKQVPQIQNDPTTYGLRKRIKLTGGNLKAKSNTFRENENELDK